MKKITKLFVFAIAVLSLNLAVAQNTPTIAKAKVKGAKVAKLTTEQKATKNADSLKVRLGLSDVQYAKVIPINSEFFKAKDALKLKAKTDSTAMASYKSDIKVLHASRKKQIAALLTPEQKKNWTLLRKQNKANPKANKMKKEDDDIDANEE